MPEMTVTPPVCVTSEIWRRFNKFQDSKYYSCKKLQ